MKTPSISVIIPTCDRPAQLREAIASVCAQSLLPSELLVIDDSLTGEVEQALLPTLSDAPLSIRVLRGEGRGPGAARNIGLRAATGDLIAFLDDDDLWRPHKLACQVACFLHRPTLGLLGTCAIRAFFFPFSSLPSPLSSRLSPLRLLASSPLRLHSVSRASLAHANRLVTSSVLARRRCFEDCGGFDESLPLAQDWDLWLRLSRRWEVGVLSAELVIYRLHPSQRSIHSAEMRACEARLLRRVTEEESGWVQAVAKRRLSWALCRLARARLREHEPAQAARVLRDALILHPLNFIAWSTLASCALATRRGLSQRQTVTGSDP